MSPFLQTLLLLLKFLGKLAFLVLMAVKNFVFILIEILVALIPNREAKAGLDVK